MVFEIVIFHEVSQRMSIFMKSLLTQNKCRKSQLHVFKSLQHADNCFRAPADCLQYFTGTSGSFRSFNFQMATPQILQMQDYSICFRQEEGKATTVEIFF